MEAVRPDPTVDAAFVSGGVHPAESENPVQESGPQGIPNTEEWILLKVDTAGEIWNLDDVYLMKVDTANSRASVIDENSETFVLVRKLSRENYVSDEIVANLAQVAEVLYPLREVLDEQTQWPTVSIKQTAIVNTGTVLKITLCFILDCGNKSSETPLANHGLRKRLIPSIRVALENDWLRFPALSQLALHKEAYGYKR